MEKIQSAIDKARAARTVATSAAPNGPAANPMVADASLQPAGSGAAAAWAALQPYTPNLPRLLSQRVVALGGGKDVVPFDMMRTKVIQQMRANGWRRLAITSPTPFCGKSTIALNLAFSLARQSELRTVLGELDLRRPTLAKMLSARGRAGFARVLEGRADFADVALRYSDGLALALNDGQVRNPAELLHGSAVSTALAAIDMRYAPDLMIFDMPPMLVSDDVMAFMGHVDAVLLIAAAETTTIKEIDACERELAVQTNVMGVVLNKCHYMGQEYGYSYYG